MVFFGSIDRLLAERQNWSQYFAVIIHPFSGVILSCDFLVPGSAVFRLKIVFRFKLFGRNQTDKNGIKDFYCRRFKFNKIEILDRNVEIFSDKLGEGWVWGEQDVMFSSFAVFLHFSLWVRDVCINNNFPSSWPSPNSRFSFLSCANGSCTGFFAIFAKLTIIFILGVDV